MTEALSGSKYQIRAVDRALDILELFMGAPELSLTDIARLAHLPKSSAFKALSVLEQRGYVCKGQAADTYRIDLQAFRVGRQYLVSLGGLTRVARPALEELALFAPGVVASVGILYQDRVVLLDSVEIDRLQPHYRVPGAEMPTYCTALGKVLLAGQPEDVRTALLDRSRLESRTPHTIIDKTVLLAHLEQVRAQGYAIDDEEWALGMTCVSAPVRDHEGRTIGAMSVSGVKAALVADMPSLVERVCLAARRTSELLGYVDAEPKQFSVLGVQVRPIR